MLSIISLFRLIYRTNSIQGPTLVVLNGYLSDISDNTEEQNCTINVATKYGNAKNSSIKTIQNIDSEDVAKIFDLCTPELIKGFRFIDLNGVTALDYCEAVKNSIPDAISELLTPETRENNDQWINGILVFCPKISIPILDENGQPTYYVKGDKKGDQKFKVTGTDSLSIMGELVSGGKRIIEEGDFKLTKKAPKTVAKEVVLNYLNPRSNKIRRYTINNLESISIGGEKIKMTV